MTHRPRFCVLLAACCVLAQPGVSARDQGLAKNNSVASLTTVSTTGEPAVPDYVIGADDLLTVVFWRDQQLSGDVLVRPDGKISLPLLDDVQAAGLTPKQLRDRLIAEAHRFVTEPVATVVVKQINSRKVYITGQVARSGQYSLTPSMTVLQLIATAGGLLEYAKSREIRIVRFEQARSVSFVFDYDEMSRTPEKTSKNIELKPGDTVIVP